MLNGFKGGWLFISLKLRSASCLRIRVRLRFVSGKFHSNVIFKITSNVSFSWLTEMLSFPISTLLHNLASNSSNLIAHTGINLVNCWQKLAHYCVLEVTHFHKPSLW